MAKDVGPTVDAGIGTGVEMEDVKGRQTDSRKLENDSGLIRPRARVHLNNEQGHQLGNSLAYRSSTLLGL